MIQVILDQISSFYLTISYVSNEERKKSAHYKKKKH